MQKIVVDTFGADAGLPPVVTGVAKALAQKPDWAAVFVGDEAEISALLAETDLPAERYEILHTDKAISNNDPPTCIFGGCDDTSMAMALGRLKSDDACVALLSAGNTGALLVGSICRLGLLPGLKFPALASALPCGRENLVCLVDCGANIDCTSDDLARFAKMGSVFSSCICGIQEPRVGLMNVGREDAKGNALTKEAFDKIKALPICFVGNLEGSDLLSGYADVVVSDGFAGNILLKSVEAAGKRAMEIVGKEGVGADPAILDKIKKALFATFDFNAQGAATFLGPRKTVVKMHGAADEDTAVASVEQILRLQAAGFVEAMAGAMKK